MDDKTLTKVWTILGIALLYITLNAWIITQAGVLFDIPLNIFSERLRHQKVATALFGIIICAPMSWYLTYLAILYKRNRDGKILDKIPVAFNLEINTTKNESKIYQYFFLFIFHFAPVIGQIHFLKKIFTHGKPVYWKTDSQISFWGIKQFWYALIGKEMYGIDCVTIDNKMECIGFYPFVEPILIILFVAFSLFITMYYLFFTKHDIKD